MAAGTLQPPAIAHRRPCLTRRPLFTSISNSVYIPITLEIVTLGPPTQYNLKGQIFESHAMKTELHISKDTNFEQLSSQAHDRAFVDLMEKLFNRYEIRENSASGTMRWTFAVQHSGPRAPITFDARSWPRVKAHLLASTEDGQGPQLRGYIFRKVNEGESESVRPTTRRTPEVGVGI